MKVHSNLSKASPMCGTNVESNGGEGTGQTEEGDNATDGTVLELKGQLEAFNNLTLFSPPLPSSTAHPVHEHIRKHVGGISYKITATKALAKIWMQ